MEADRKAPAFAESSVQVDAPPEIVWEVMADIDAWPTWNPDVKKARLEGPLNEGSIFKWKAGPGTITSTLRVVDEPHRIAWTGVTFGVKAIHVWRIDPRGSGSVVTTEESWDGLFAKLFRRYSQKTLDRALEAGPLYLKEEAERRSGSEA